MEVEEYLDANPEADVWAVGLVASEIAPDGVLGSGGQNASDTSAVLLDVYDFLSPDGEYSFSEVTIASSEAFPDALTGGAYAARNGIPMLLSPDAALGTMVAEALERRGPFQTITLFGGNAALSDTVAGQVSAHLAN